MTTYADVKKQIAQLEKKAADLRKVEVTKVVANIREQMAQYELTVEDISPSQIIGEGKGGYSQPEREDWQARQVYGPEIRQDVDRSWQGACLDCCGHQKGAP